LFHLSVTLAIFFAVLRFLLMLFNIPYIRNVAYCSSSAVPCLVLHFFDFLFVMSHDEINQRESTQNQIVLQAL